MFNTVTYGVATNNIRPAAAARLSDALLLQLGELSPLEDHVVERVEPLVQPLAGDGARGLHVAAVRVARARRQLAQPQQPLQLPRLARARQVLLVGQHQDGHARVVRRLGRADQLHLGLLHALHVHRVQHEHDAVRAARVRLPQRPQLLLPAHVPHEEVDALGLAEGALHLLAVEADGGHRVEVLVELEPVERGGLAGGVQAQHDDVQRALRRRQRVQQARVLAHVGAHAAPYLTQDRDITNAQCESCVRSSPLFVKICPTELNFHETSAKSFPI